jgi:ABC-type branched-subunit amino acid transport system substrate-binding protein
MCSTLARQFAAVTSITLLGISSLSLAYEPQGDSKTESVLGTLQDLSGPLAPLGAPLRNGLQMRLDEANERAGVHGRKLRLVVEDTGYDPRKAVLATQKLIQKDQIFAVIGNLGSAVVNATMTNYLDAGIPHLFPAAPQSNTYEPRHKLKFAITPAYSITTPLAAKYLIQQNGYKKIGLLYQDDDYGHDVVKGIEALARELNTGLCEKASYKRGATDFSSQIAKLKAADCDFLVLATVVRETIGAYAAARTQGWKVPMLVTVAGYTAQIHQLGGATMDGLYAALLTPHPYPDAGNKPLLAWIDNYRKRYSAEPSTWSVLGYSAADLLVKSLERAGPALTTERLVAAMESVRTSGDIFGSPAYAFTPDDHLASHAVRVAQIRNGHWETVSDNLESK